MDSIKKNPVFAAVMLVCLLVFLAGAALAFMAAGAVAKSDKKLQSAERGLEAAHRGDPAPSQDSVEASAQNLEALVEQLKRIRTDLERGASLELSNDGVVVMASIQQFIIVGNNQILEAIKIEIPHRNFSWVVRECIILVTKQLCVKIILKSTKPKILRNFHLLLIECDCI